jgi:predicted dehydrogenase
MITPVSRVRTCIIGAGPSARKHIAGWQSVSDSTVVAIVDVDESRAHTLAEEFGIETIAADYRTILERSDINIVSLCTPSVLTGPIGLDAINNHKHIFSERNMTHALDECSEILTAAQRNRVAVGKNFPRRYEPSFARIREMLVEGILGRPVIYRVHYLMPTLGSTLERSEHQGMKTFLDLFADHYDIWRWLFRSEVTRVTARGFSWAQSQHRRRTELAAPPDTGAAIVEFGSRDMAVITVSHGLPPGFEAFQVQEEEIFGPLGQLSDIETTQFTHKDHSGRAQDYRFLHQQAYTEAIQDFANRVRRGEPPRVSGDDAKRALRIGLAVCTSIETGKTVDF